MDHGRRLLRGEEARGVVSVRRRALSRRVRKALVGGGVGGTAAAAARRVRLLARHEEEGVLIILAVGRSLSAGQA
jgi:hypothetical protein